VWGAVGAGAGPCGAVRLPALRGEDFARKGRRRRKLYTAADGGADVVERGLPGLRAGVRPAAGDVGVLGKRRTDRLTVDLTELSTQVSFARAGQISRQLASTGATCGQAHNAVADTAAL